MDCSLFKHTRIEPLGLVAGFALLAFTLPVASYEIDVLNAPISDSEALADRGHALVAGGNWVFLGAPGEDSAAGAVHAFNCDAGGCAPVQRLQAVKPRDRQAFGAALSLDGSRLAVGSPERDDGHVDLFELQVGTWTHAQRLVVPDGESNARFGWSLALSGDRLLVGAPAVAENSGAVYAFAREAGTWVFRERLQSPVPAPQQRFGFSVAQSGNRALVSLPTYDPDGAGAAYARGAVVAFDFDGLSWQSQGMLLPTAAADGDRFGSQLALLGTRAIIGVPGNLMRTGRVDVFEHDGVAWLPAASLASTQPRAGGRFGWAVSLSANGILAAAPFAGDDGSEACGTAEWFEPVGLSAWSGRVLATRRSRPSGAFGFALAQAGDLSLASAPLTNRVGLALAFRPAEEVFADGLEPSSSGCPANLP